MSKLFGGLTPALLAGNVRGMEALRNHLNDLTTDQQTALADRCGTSVGYLRKAISVGQTLGAATCVAIEVATRRHVMRWDLRPDDWHLIWPELVGTKGAPKVAKARAA